MKLLLSLYILSCCIMPYAFSMEKGEANISLVSSLGITDDSCALYKKQVDMALAVGNKLINEEDLTDDNSVYQGLLDLSDILVAKEVNPEIGLLSKNWFAQTQEASTQFLAEENKKDAVTMYMLNAAADEIEKSSKIHILRKKPDLQNLNALHIELFTQNKDIVGIDEKNNFTAAFLVVMKINEFAQQLPE